MIIKKPWGYEEILISKPYVIKELHINAGHRISLQYHEVKTETMIVQYGEGVIFHHKMYTPVKQGGVVHIPFGIVHRVEASKKSDLVILEVSTTELDDTVKLADDYGRI